MKNLFLFLLTLLSLTAFAQSGSDALPLPDSLVGRLKEHRKTDVARAEALDAAIMFYVESRRVLEAEPYINELITLSEELEDNYWKALSLYFKSLCAYTKLDFSEFLPLINESKQITETLRVTACTHLLMSNIYLIISDYYISIKLLPESYSAIQEGLKVDPKNFKLKNNLGVIYMQMQNHHKAIEVYKELLKEKKDIAYYDNISSSYNSIESFDSSLLYIDSALYYSSTSYDSLIVMVHKSNLLIRKSELQKAKQCNGECVRLMRVCKDNKLIYNVYLNSACISANEGNLLDALALIEKAQIVSEALEGANINYHDHIKLKAEIYRAMNDYKTALDCLFEYDSIRDVLSLQQNNEKIYDIIHQQETRILEQQYEAEHQIAKQRQQYVVIIAMLIIVFVVVVMCFLIKNRRQKEILLKQEIDVRDREITAKSMGKMQSNELLNDVIEKLSEMEVHPEKNILSNAIRDLKTLVDVDTKKDFDLHFVQMHPDFYQKLLTDFPKLTQNELRLCAFVKSNLSIKEIAAINGISADSVKTARKRLRKSLNLTGEDVSLLEFLSKY